MSAQPSAMRVSAKSHLSPAYPLSAEAPRAYDSDDWIASDYDDLWHEWALDVLGGKAPIINAGKREQRRELHKALQVAIQSHKSQLRANA